MMNKKQKIYWTIDTHKNCSKLRNKDIIHRFANYHRQAFKLPQNITSIMKYIYSMQSIIKYNDNKQEQKNGRASG